MDDENKNEVPVVEEKQNYFTVEIEWVAGSTEEDIAQANAMMSSAIKEKIEAPEDEFPICVKSVKIIRN